MDENIGDWPRNWWCSRCGAHSNANVHQCSRLGAFTQNPPIKEKAVCLDKRDENFSNLFSHSAAQARELDEKDRQLKELRLNYSGLMEQHKALREEYESACRQIVTQAAQIRGLESWSEDLPFIDPEDVIWETDLHEAIKAHHDATKGHGMCWENDVELWKAIGIDDGYPHDTLPSWCEFMTKCAEYRASREPAPSRLPIADTTDDLLNNLTVAELKAVIKLQHELVKSMQKE